MTRFHYLLQIIAFSAVFFVKVECQAGVVISIDKAVSQAGQTVLLGVYASSEIGDLISGFNLPFDYNSDGFVDARNDGLGDLPAGFTFSAAPLVNVLYSNTGLDQPKPQVQLIGVDSIVTGTGSDIVLGNSLNPTKLFDLVISVDPTVPVGTLVPFQIKAPSDPFSSLFNVAGPKSPAVIAPSPGVPATGSILIVAVPEPGTVSLLLSVSLLSSGAYRMRRRVFWAA